tara:strand:+ start:3589 stop:5076 length:1488 start_codon:yes stop_codon:yes gene_type:complete
MSQNNLKEIKKIRLEKIDFLKRKSIHPYAYKYNVENSINEIKQNPEEYLEKATSIAGRIISLRKMGKSCFLNIQDMDNKIQVYIKDSNLKPDEYDNIVRKLDLGDIIGVKGVSFYTKTKELSIKSISITLLSKNIYPLPNMKEKDGETFFSFDDKEHRYRKRYLDLIINNENKLVFIKRSQIINNLRDFLNLNKYIEVETPILQPIYGGANAKPFITYHNTLDEKLYLRIADELYLKRLIIGGFNKVYEISKNFRNEGMDRNHNPEFTMLEFYSAFEDVYSMMKFTESLIQSVAKNINFIHENIDFNKKFNQISFFESLDKFSSKKISAMDNNELLNLLKSNKIKVDKNSGRGKLLDKLFSHYVEPNLIAPTFVIDYPLELSPLAKELRESQQSGIVERFELFIDGMEIANAFSELNDPQEQRFRLTEQSKLRDLGDEEAQVLDEDFLEAMETGMPPTGGVGVGVDRLVMILTNQKSIKDVILFPAMKNEKSKNS